MTVIDDADVFDPSKTFNNGTAVDVLALEENMAAQNYSNDIFVALDLEDLRNTEVMTCFPDIKGGLAPTILSHVSSLVDYLYDTNIGASFFEFQGDATAGLESRYLPGTQTKPAGARQPFVLGHNITKWVCVKNNYLTNQILGNSSSESNDFFNLFDPYMAEDYKKIVDGNFIGGYGMDYAGGTTSRTYGNGQQPDPNFPEPTTENYTYNFTTNDLVL